MRHSNSDESLARGGTRDWQTLRGKGALPSPSSPAVTRLSGGLRLPYLAPQSQPCPSAFKKIILSHYFLSFNVSSPLLL